MNLTHSYSSIKKHLQCPKADYHLNIKRDVRDYGNDATRYGNRVHKALELRVKESQPLPNDLKWLERVCAKLQAANGEVFTEQRMGLDRALKACSWKERWIGGIVDISLVSGARAFLGDWKTGNPAYVEDEQLKLMAAMIFAHHEEVQDIHASFLHLKNKTMDTIRLNRDDIKQFWKEYLPNIKRRLDAVKTDTFPAKPSKLCDWCAVKKQGVCKYG